jgi:hypothetical protein
MVLKCFHYYYLLIELQLRHVMELIHDYNHQHMMLF